MKKQNVGFNLIELLSTTVASVPMQEGKLPILLLNVRLEPSQSFEPCNLALSRDAAQRLYHDLGHLLATSPAMKLPRLKIEGDETPLEMNEAFRPAPKLPGARKKKK